MLFRFPFIILFFMVALMTAFANAQSPEWMNGSQSKLEQELVSKYGETQHERISSGLKQVKDFWRSQDGDAAVFEEFIRTNFAGDQATLDAMFVRFENLLEQLYGHMNEIGLEFRRQTDLDLGTVYPFDEIFAAYSPDAHITD